MRKLWLNVVTLSTAISFGACAAGTQTEAPTANVTSGGSNDAGSGAQQTTGSEDAGTGITPPASGGDDAGQQQAPPTTGQDSGGPTETPDSAVPTSPVDSGPPVIVPPVDSGPPVTPATCPSTSTYDNEWLNTSANAPVCTSSADCAASECCYIPTAIEVILLGGTAACVAF